LKVILSHFSRRIQVNSVPLEDSAQGGGQLRMQELVARLLQFLWRDALAAQQERVRHFP
jgi:hypothetical protein